MAEIDEAGSWTDYIYSGGRRLAKATGTSPSGTSFYHNDHLGSARLMTDSAAQVVYQGTFTPYGIEVTPQANAPTHYKFAGKERELAGGVETGIDYSGARYYHYLLGRFTSPDPIYFQESMLADPQQLNLYGYVRNNPLNLIDPAGEAIALTGDEEERKKQLEALRELAGKAGKYLYDNAYTDPDGQVRHYVGIYTNGEDGKGPDFGSISDVTSELQGIINDPRVGQLDFQSAGSSVTDDRTGATTIIGPVDDSKPFQSPGAVTYSKQDNRFHFNILDKGPYGVLPALFMSNNRPGILTRKILVGHEVTGHGFLPPGEVSDSRAVNVENQIRQSKNPNAPYRLFHNPSVIY
jgi:RHS repeat-associated protein